MLCYIFATKACIDNWKKNLLNSNTFSTYPHSMMHFGPIMAENCWRVWGTPANFNGFRVSAALLHGTPAVSVPQTLQRRTEGATYIRQGGHHVGHWPTFLVEQIKLECWPMPNVIVALPNIGGALCSTPQSLADTHYLTAVQ